MSRKLAAIFVADIAGYSRLVAEDEEETLHRLKAYRGITDELIARAGGRIFNTAGDAVLAEFPSAVEAVRCAIDIQESLRTKNSAFLPSRQMSFRIGISIGDVVEREADLLGEGVNIAARLQGLAAVGGICVSRGVYEQVANRLSVEFSDIGAQEVKNMPPVHAYMIGKLSHGDPKGFRRSRWGFLRARREPLHTPAGEASSTRTWAERFEEACDRQTLSETLVAFVALLALTKMPVVAAIFGLGLIWTHGAGVLTYAAVGLLSSAIVFVTTWLLNRRLQLTSTERATAAVAYGAFSLLGPAAVPVLPYVGLGGYEADYIGGLELPILFGCIGASAALWRKFRTYTVFAVLVLTTFLLGYRYALFNLSVRYFSAVVTLPVVLIGCLVATAKWRVSATLDVAAIIAVWLISSSAVPLMPVVLSVFPHSSGLLNTYGGIYLVAMALPTALAWPAIRLARPDCAWQEPTSSPLSFDKYLRAGVGILAGVYVVGFISSVAEHNTSIYRCTMTADSTDACAAVIDSTHASAKDRIQALETRARRYEQESKWDQAIGDLTKLIELDPKNPERYTARAGIWSEVESYDQAIADLDAAVALQPNNPKLYRARSRLWEKKGDDNRASADLDQFVRLEPSAENFVKRAEYNLDKDRINTAVADYSMAIKMDRKNVDYLKARAVALQKKGDAASAKADYLSIISLYDASIATAPTADTVRERAKIWEQLKNYKKAMADYALAIRLDPGDGYNYDFRYFLVQKIADSPAEVMKYLDDFVSKEPTFAHNYRIRAKSRGEDEIEKALADYDQAIRLKPDDGDFRLARAALLEKKGALVEAIADYDRALKVDPKNANALYRRGMAKSIKGDRTGAADIAAAKALDTDVGK